MTSDPQTVVALLLVALATGYLLQRAFRRRRKAANDCGCPPDKFKQTVRRPRR